MRDRPALTAYAASRAAVVVLALGGARLLAHRMADRVQGFLDLWAHWDATLYVKIARWGYTGYPVHYPDRGVEAFFPGLPLVLRAVHVLVRNWTACGLVVALAAGAVAVVALDRLAALDGVPPGRAPLVLVLSPYAVFLAAGYSEALFLALAVPCWLAARRGRWGLAGVLCALTCAVRVNGAFLWAALAVELLAARRGRPGRDGLALLLPATVLLAYAAYLHALTGDWLRWLHAQQQGWNRALVPPWQALERTVRAAAYPHQGAEYQWSWTAEVLAVLVGVAATAVLLRQRRWGEAAYVGLSVGSLACSTLYLSVARGCLLWFPLWLLLARWGGRPWRRTAYAWVSAPLMALGVLTFTSGAWTG